MFDVVHLSPSPIRFAALTKFARALVSAAVAPNTLRAYNAQWRLWLAYARAAGIAPLPAAPHDVANWLAGRHARDGAANATLRSAAAAIRMAHLAAELPFDTRDPAIALVLRGAGRISGRQQRQVTPLRSAMVADILTHLGTSPRDLRDGAVIALGYCFARRRSELAGLDHERLCGGDGWLTSTNRTLEIHLTRTKAIAGTEAEVYVVPRARNHLAVGAIGRWIAAAGIAPGEALLRRVYKSGRIAFARLDPQSISLILKARVAEHFERQGLGAAEAARLARNYSGHSLRVGFAVTSAEAGASIVAIQRALGHRTPMMAARYARKAELARLSPHLLDGVAPKRPARAAAKGAPVMTP